MYFLNKIIKSTFSEVFLNIPVKGALYKDHHFKRVCSCKIKIKHARMLSGKTPM